MHLSAYKDFYLLNQYLFKGKRLCIPQGSLRASLIREAHEGGIMGILGQTDEGLSCSFLRLLNMV